MILVTCKIHCIPPHFHTREGSFITITNTRSFLFSFKISSAKYARTNKLGTIRGNMNIFERASKTAKHPFHLQSNSKCPQHGRYYIFTDVCIFTGCIFYYSGWWSMSGYHADTPITIKAEASSKADSRPN